MLRLSVSGVTFLLGVLAVVPSGAVAASDWRSYGIDLANSRSQPHPAGVGVATARRLVERWSIRHAGPVDGINASVTGTPAVADGTAYYTDWTGRLVATSLRTGQVRWSTKVSVATAPLTAAVWSSPTVAGNTVYVAAFEGRVVAVSARTGRVRWSTQLDRREFPGMQASPTVSGHTLIVGVASTENFFGNPPYDFRGSVAALDTQTGRKLWQTFTMPADGDGRGGSVWGTAAIDKRRGLAYIGTGQAYAPPVGQLNDALLALRLRDGSIAWHRQFTRDDVWNVFGGGFSGKDYDLGASPNLFRIGRRDVVGVGDKGGRYATLDRTTGSTVWRRALCPGSHYGGIMTTAAVARGSIWVTCNTLAPDVLQHSDLTDPYFDFPDQTRLPSYTDIFRLDAPTGRTLWRRRVPGITFGAVTEAGGAVFVPNTDGTLRALNARTGRVLWTTHPGAPLGGGATVASGTVLIGYGVQFGLLGRATHANPNGAGGIVAYKPRR